MLVGNGRQWEHGYERGYGHGGSMSAPVCCHQYGLQGKAFSAVSDRK